VAQRRPNRKRGPKQFPTRAVEVEGEPLDPETAAFVEEALTALETGVNRLWPGSCPDYGRLAPSKLTGELEALAGSPVPHPWTAAVRAVEAVQRGTAPSALPLAVPRGVADIIGRDLHIDRIGVIRLSRSLGEGLAFVEASIRRNIFPPPSFVITLTLCRSADLSREGKLART
jgi:hypothetical protein